MAPVDSDAAPIARAPDGGEALWFMRALAVPAQELAPPPPPDGPPDMERVMAAAAEYGIEILGPPGLPAA